MLRSDQRFSWRRCLSCDLRPPTNRGHSLDGALSNASKNYVDVKVSVALEAILKDGIPKRII